MRTVFPQKKFFSPNPDYDFGGNTAGNFIPPYTGYYYMRAVGGGGSGSLRSDSNECVGGGAGGGYDGEILLEGGVAIPYSVGMGGAAVALGNWGNNGADTIFGSIILKGGYGGSVDRQGGRGGSAGNCKGGVTYLLIVSRPHEIAQSSQVLFGGGSGMTHFHNDTFSHFDYLANACGKNGFTKETIDYYNSVGYFVRFGGCSVFGVPVNYVPAHSPLQYGTGGCIYKAVPPLAANGKNGRIQIWRLQ